MSEGMTLLALSKRSKKVRKLLSNMRSNYDRRFTISNRLLNTSHCVVSSGVEVRGQKESITFVILP